MYTYYATLIRVVDGDTVDLDVDLGFHTHVRLRFRLSGIDTPEIRGTERERGKVAKQETTRLLGLGRIKVRSHKTGSFGRWLAEVLVETEEGEINVNNELLAGGFASPYIK